MHSNRMRSVHRLTVYSVGGGTAWRGICLERVWLEGEGSAWRGRDQTPPGQTNTGKNITFPQLRLRAAITIVTLKQHDSSLVESKNWLFIPLAV